VKVKTVLPALPEAKGMQILRATTTGMCFGVRDALDETGTLDRPEDVTIHGELVHNDAVLTELGARGFRSTRESDRSDLPTTRAVLITAHGISDTERRRLMAAGKQLIDTTCPLVTRVHQEAQALRRAGYHVLVVGRRHHVEVRGIVEDLEAFEIIENETEVRVYPFPRLGVVCQTTTAPATVAAVRVALVFQNPHAEIRFQDTTCSPTRQNQRALAELLPKVEAVVVVGGRNSNNTGELAAHCVAAGKPVMRVQDVDGLQSEWFVGMTSVGLVAGTSTLDATLDAVESRLRQFANQKSTSLGPGAVKSSAEWLDYFQANAKNQWDVSWNLGAGIASAELAEISDSLRGWQLGETSDGSHLLAASANYAAKVRDPLFVDVVRLFIAEEQRHGHHLGRFLDLAGIERAKSDWGDTLFRRIRYSVPSMEVWATPVVMVETHAMIYYDAIRRSSRSAVLRGICDQILRDEVEHIRFQCERLAILHRQRPGWLRALTKLAHRVLFAGITIAVWTGHRRAYRAGGYGFSRFWQAAWTRMRFAWRIMAPESYQWPAADPWACR
jgi:(E)-4-hydroxy-3-methyl-but-2-enyl pyrophosphate reductase